MTAPTAPDTTTASRRPHHELPPKALPMVNTPMPMKVSWHSDTCPA